MTIDSESLKKKFDQLARGLLLLSAKKSLTCISLHVDGYIIGCRFNYTASDDDSMRTLKFIYPIDPYTVTEENVFDRLAGTVLIAFGVVPLDHTSTKSRIADFIAAGQQQELFV